MFMRVNIWRQYWYRVTDINTTEAQEDSSQPVKYYLTLPGRILIIQVKSKAETNGL